MVEFNKKIVFSKDKEFQLTLIKDPFSVNTREIKAIICFYYMRLFCSWKLLNYNVQYSTKVNTEKTVCKIFIKVWIAKSIRI